MLLVSHLKYLWLCPRLQNFSLMFSYLFVVLTFTFRSLVHFKIFLCITCGKGQDAFIFSIWLCIWFHMVLCSTWLLKHYLKALFLHWITWSTVLQLNIWVWIYLCTLHTHIWHGGLGDSLVDFTNKTCLKIN